MRPFWDFPRQVGSLRVLWELGRDHGLDAAQVLQGTGLTPRDFDSPRRLVGAGQELQTIRNLLAELGHDLPLGLEAGLRHHPTTFSSWGFAILSSLTARQAVEIGLRYLRLTSAYSDVRIEESGGEAMLVSDARGLPEDVRTFLLERDIATLHTIKNDVLPVNIPLTRLELQIAKPLHASRYEELFGIRPRFGQPLNRIGVSAALGSIRLPQGNPAALQYCEQECRRLLNEHQERSGTASRVREQLLRQTRQIPTMTLMAATLETSPRSLRRRLQDEGTDYETLVEEVRHTLAEQLLITDALSVEQIAERLGYAEMASFSRAFKRWTGQSPRSFRNAARSGI